MRQVLFMKPRGRATTPTETWTLVLVRAARLSLIPSVVHRMPWWNWLMATYSALRAV